jgi:hypothetical protein
MVFNATFNNITIISWRSVLFVEETRVPVKIPELPKVTDQLYLIMMYRVHLAVSRIRTQYFRCDSTDRIGSCKSKVTELIQS